MKIFISQPMRGKTEEEIMNEREIAINDIKARYGANVEISYSVSDETPPSTSTHTSVWYLGKSIEILSNADKAYFVNGWEEANGCIAEHLVCENYGIDIIYEED